MKLIAQGTSAAELHSEIPHPRPMVFEWRVDGTDLSQTVAHVNNVTYLQWVDQVAERAGEVLGHTRAHLAEINRMWFVARHEIDYLAETFEGDVVRAATWIIDRRRSSCRRATMMWTQHDSKERTIARAVSTWTWIDLERRRPSRMPENIIRLIDTLEAASSPNEVTP